MAFGDVIQTAENSVASGAVTVTFSSATAGNLLIFCVARSSALAVGTTWGTPTGWTALTNTPENVGNLGATWYYKIAAGGETSVTSAESTPPGNGRGVVVEFAGPFATTPLDQTAENESNLSTVVTSQASGTTGTTSQADELAVVFFGADTAINVDGSRSYNNSFSEVIFSNAVTNNSRAAVAVARRVLSATGTYSCTYSCTDTGDEMYGAIATFKAQSGGGISVTPTAASSTASSVNPTAILGSLSVTPGAAAASTTVIAPTAILGSVSVTPSICTTSASTVAPLTIYGSVIIDGIIALARALVLNPQVQGGETSSAIKNVTHYLFNGFRR